MGPCHVSYPNSVPGHALGAVRSSWEETSEAEDSECASDCAEGELESRCMRLNVAGRLSEEAESGRRSNTGALASRESESELRFDEGENLP